MNLSDPQRPPGDPVSFVLLIHPPVVKPCEPPAGVARIAGALRQNDVPCEVIDANLEGLSHLLSTGAAAEDTWSHRAHLNRDRHLQALRSPATYRRPDAYRRAVADLDRILGAAGGAQEITAGLGDYRDRKLSPLRSADLRRAAAEPQRNPFYGFYREKLLPRVADLQPALVGLSINFLSQALCAFALIGMLKSACPDLKIVLGGSLITSWMRRPGGFGPWRDLVDWVVEGAGEPALLEFCGRPAQASPCCPDYRDLMGLDYLSPGFILPFSASQGCWWRRCTFCPEHSERRPFRPLPHRSAVAQLRRLTAATRPALIHLLDNALSPALLKALAAHPPGAGWYGFVRLSAPLDDPAFCRRLAQAGCTMLKVGLESGSQAVLDALGKGVRLATAVQILENLKLAGIAAYVYLLFGTPAEDEAAAHQTLGFVADHHALIGFLNLALFNLPLGSGAGLLPSRDFYEGDLALYRDFDHPAGWHRRQVRRFLDKTFKKHPAVQPILRRDPPLFTSNHAPFFMAPKAGFTGGQLF